MRTRVPASMRTRESLSALIEGRLSSPDGRSELVKRATRLILEEALEAETRDALGRDYYERGAEEGRGYRNGHRTEPDPVPWTRGWVRRPWAGWQDHAVGGGRWG